MALTGRQVDVLRGVALGLTNRQIAFALGLRPQTVRNHLSRIYAKLLPGRFGGERGRKYRLLAVLRAWRELGMEGDLMGRGAENGNGQPKCQ